MGFFFLLLPFLVCFVVVVACLFVFKHTLFLDFWLGKGNPRVFVLRMLFNSNFMLPKLSLFWLVGLQDSNYNSMGLSAYLYSKYPTYEPSSCECWNMRASINVRWLCCLHSSATKHLPTNSETRFHPWVWQPTHPMDGPAS